jgi:hypothetical protein
VQSLPMIGVRKVLAHLIGHVGDVEFDGPSATRLEVYEHRPVFHAEHIPRVRLAVQQLFGGTSVADRPS